MVPPPAVSDADHTDNDDDTLVVTEIDLRVAISRLNAKVTHPRPYGLDLSTFGIGERRYNTGA